MGGTFTDVLLMNLDSGATYRAKTPSTPHDQSVGILDGILKACDKAGVSTTDITELMHGITVATNAIQRLRTRPEYAELVEGLQPHDGEPVLTKQYASAFHGTSLLSLLNFKRVDSLLITGVSTSGCIRATATDAIQHGLIPMVVRDAVGDRSPQIHEANLFDLQAKYADLYTAGEVMGRLSDK